MRRDRQLDYPLLYSLQCFNYCDPLLAAPERAAWQQLLRTAGGPRPQHAAKSSSVDESLGQLAMEAAATGDRSRSELIASCRAVSQRAAQMLKIAQDSNLSLLTHALDQLTLGRAALYAAILERSATVSAGPAAATPNPQSASGSSNAFFPAEVAAGGALPTPALQALQTARRELDGAVAGLRRAGQQIMLPRGLLTRAWCSFAEAMEHRLQGRQQEAAEFERRAQADLDEAWEIAERGPMRLFMADIALSRARLFGSPKSEIQSANYPWESPAAYLAPAEKLINDCGYHRRDGELADAKRAILGL